MKHTKLHRKIHLLPRLVMVMVVIIVLGYFVSIYANSRYFISQLSPTLLLNSYVPALEYYFNKPKTANNSHVIESNEQAIPVLLYHGIVTKDDGANVLIENFKNQMFALKNAGYQTVTIDDFISYMEGKRRLPDKSFLLTFDDGRKDSYYPVDPILAALNYHAVMFVITKHAFVDTSSTYYLNKSELQQMVKSGRWDIQSHSQDGHDEMKISKDNKQGHFYSNYLWLNNENRLETESEYKQRVINDLKGAKADLEQLGVRVQTIALPYGDYGQDSINNPSAQNFLQHEIPSIYTYAFTSEGASTDSSYNYPGDKTKFLSRIEVQNNWTPDNLIKVLSVGAAKEIPFTDNFSDYEGWIANDGDMNFIDNKMTLININGNSSSVYLDGTKLWKDYSYHLIADWGKGSNLLLVARYNDIKNYVACNFGNSLTRIEQRVNGKNKILQETKYAIKLPIKQNLSLQVDGNTIKCASNNSLISQASFDGASLSEGGIGIMTWDKQKDNTEISMDQVLVENNNLTAQPIASASAKVVTNSKVNKQSQKRIYGGWYWQPQLHKALVWLGKDKNGKDIWATQLPLQHKK